MKKNVIAELVKVSKVTITSDGWTSTTQDHYVNITLHYVYEGQLKQKVLSTHAAYESEVLVELGVKAKVVAMTVDNAGSGST